MTRVVLDTNILASGAIATTGSTLARITDGWQNRRYEIVVSSVILNELRRTLSNPYFSRRLSPPDVQDYMRWVQSVGIMPQVTTRIVGVATHPEDDAILATALDGAADYLVTGDKQLQSLGTFRGVALVSPADFVRLAGLGCALALPRARRAVVEAPRDASGYSSDPCRGPSGGGSFFRARRCFSSSGLIDGSVGRSSGMVPPSSTMVWRTLRPTSW